MRKPHHITLVINMYNVKLLKLPTSRLATSKIIAQAYYGRNSRFLLKDQRNYFMTSYIEIKTAIIFRQKPPKTCCFLIFIPMFNTKAIFAMWSTSFKFCLFSTSCVRIHWFNFGNIFFSRRCCGLPTECDRGAAVRFPETRWGHGPSQMCLVSKDECAYTVLLRGRPNLDSGHTYIKVTQWTLLWGACCSVFAVKLTHSKIRNTAHQLYFNILHTDYLCGRILLTKLEDLLKVVVSLQVRPRLSLWNLWSEREKSSF